jgi:succinate-acetate transporter protein
MVQLAPVSFHGKEVVADPTPMGLLGLAIGCAALTPIAFGKSLTPAGLETAAVFCLLFGAGCQLFAGLLNLVNRNLYGGTLFLTFAFNWVVNAWALHSLAKGFVPDPTVIFATEVAFLVIFVLISWGFGHFSSLLFVFLLDIDLLYVLKVAGHLLDTRAFAIPIALLTVGLAVIALWIAFALLLNPVTGRRIFTLGTPVFRSAAKPQVDLSVRTALVATLYGQWREAGPPLSQADLLARLAALGEPRLKAELAYLSAQGVVEPGEGTVRLSPTGIDLWEKHCAA